MNYTQEDRERAKKLTESKIAGFITENKERGTFLSLVPKSMQKLFLDSYTANSKARAIKAKCLDCSCFNKEEVKNCAAITCPLWNFRPYRDK